MKKFFRYLTTAAEDINWGIYLKTAGSLNIPPQEEYPPIEHPSGYYFTWEQGRKLQEYQLNYITEGEGIFENKTGTFPVKAGSLMVISPGMWHRYKPNFQSGWTENYIGFKGKAIENFMKHRLFSPEHPVIQLGEREEILDTFLKIFDLIEAEQPGFQHIASGLIIKLLGYLVAFDKQKEFSGKPIARIIEEARFRMRSEVGRNFDIEKFAAENNVGYSWFRRMFKNYTGLSPRQYCLQLKIIRAKELLLSTDLSVKEISYELGFESIHYFSRVFKQKTGKSPSDFRG
ncbi:transcriptional regulator, AraC family [Mariniphaga anaerophila]|uniref:Transcriptional regulator, AraC family n=1 Tax=Mariniphaga anaerophila TaxID=1484053 RepID=A0A1M5AS48_9BACT|nr:AraC family transcriptional regulator [Mariniphaga anaerophila]SHF33015.1 transcriptional regulator, AraC family [Mariniphaga anaerophila]